MPDCRVESFSLEMKQMYDYGKEKLENNGYIVGKCIGQGAFGKVFELKKDGKEYVMKMIYDDNNPYEMYKAIDMEIKIYEKFINSCNEGRDDVLCLYDLFYCHFNENYTVVEGKHDINENYIFIVMNKVEHISLGKYLTDNFRLKKQIPLKDKETIIHSLSKNLHFLHSQGVVHKDIKPDNIIINTETKKCVLIDYGLSCLLGDKDYEKCKYNESGTLLFMSPEMTGSRKNKALYERYSEELYAKAIDMWALGCTFYQVYNVEKLQDKYRNRAIFNSPDIYAVPIIKIATQMKEQTGETNWISPNGLQLIKNCLLTDVQQPREKGLREWFERFMLDLTSKKFNDYVLDKEKLAGVSGNRYNISITVNEIDEIIRMFNKMIQENFGLTALLWPEPTGRSLELFMENRMISLLMSDDDQLISVGNNYMKDFSDNQNHEVLLRTQIDYKDQLSPSVMENLLTYSRTIPQAKKKSLMSRLRNAFKRGNQPEERYNLSKQRKETFDRLAGDFKTANKRVFLRNPQTQRVSARNYQHNNPQPRLKRNSNSSSSILSQPMARPKPKPKPRPRPKSSFRATQSPNLRQTMNSQGMITPSQKNVLDAKERLRRRVIKKNNGSAKGQGKKRRKSSKKGSKKGKKGTRKKK